VGLKKAVSPAVFSQSRGRRYARRQESWEKAPPPGKSRVVLRKHPHFPGDISEKGVREGGWRKTNTAREGKGSLIRCTKGRERLRGKGKERIPIYKRGRRSQQTRGSSRIKS